MGNQVFLVLRSGGEYLPRHASFLTQEIQQHSPKLDVVCLSDIQVPGVQTLPLQYNYPGWWSKLELMRPDIRGDFLYLDIDTRVVDDISDIARSRQLTMLFRQTATDGTKRYGSGVMLLTQEAREYAWREWIAEGPESVMRRCKGGDQKILEWWWRGRMLTFEELYPGQVVSFKRDCKQGVPANARIVYYHGRPRPWDPAGAI